MFGPRRLALCLLVVVMALGAFASDGWAHTAGASKDSAKTATSCHPAASKDDPHCLPGARAEEQARPYRENAEVNHPGSARGARRDVQFDGQDATERATLGEDAEEQSRVFEELRRRNATLGQGAKNPYATLGVSVSATRADVKRAYRKLSLMLHPDKIKDQVMKKLANAVFMDIVAAHEVLGNEDSRQAFDDLGDADGAKKQTFSSYREYQRYASQKTRENNDFFVGHPLIVNLHSSYWHRRVSGKSVWLVDFYAPWCKHCVSLVPVYKKVAEMVESHDFLQVGAVNCEKDKPFCQRIGIVGYPTLGLFTSDANGLVEFYPRGTPKTPEKVSEWAKTRADAWSRMLETEPPPSLTLATFDQVVRASEEGWVVVFSRASRHEEKRNVRMRALALAAEVRGVVRVGLVDCIKEAQLCYEEHRLRRDSPGQVRFYKPVDQPRQELQGASRKNPWAPGAGAGGRQERGAGAGGGLSQYRGEHIVELDEVPLREALVMTARMVRILGVVGRDLCRSKGLAKGDAGDAEQGRTVVA